MGKSAPSAPDPYQSAAAQYTYGTQAADYTKGLNDVNTVSPTGSTTYTSVAPQYVNGVPVNGTGAPQITETTQLSPEQQAIFNKSQGVQSGQLDAAGNLVSTVNKTTQGGAPSIAPVQYGAGPTEPIQYGIDTNGVPSIMPVGGAFNYGQSTALAGEEAAAQPGMTQAREQLDAQLRNGGSHPGDPAYDNAMAALDASQTQQQTQLAGAAITAGTGLENTIYGESANTNQQLFSEAAQEEAARNQAQSQQFGEGTTAAQTSNTAGQTALSDWAQQVGIPINELEAILGGSQVSTPSGVAPTASNVAAPDIMSAFQNNYAGQLAAYNANVGTTNSLLGDAGSLAALAMLAA